jgi:hypothetical protein
MRIRPSTLIHALLGIYIVLMLLLFPLSLASAQAEITLESVRVDIWPEYDQPSALVIYNVSLSPGVSLPAAMTLRIPAAAGRPYAVAWQSPDQGLYDLKYEMTAAGNWIEVSFSTPSTDLRLEYYDPEIQKNGSKRDFVFNWPGDYTVENLSIMVQQPASATNMSLRPDAGGGRQAADGMTYHTLVAGQVNAGTTFELFITYDKPDDQLTNPQQFQPAQPVQAVDSSTAGRVTLDQTLPWAIGGAGILLIAGGLFWYWRAYASDKKKIDKSSRRHAHSSSTTASAAPAAPPAANEPAAFCHQCGKKASPGDIYCRACGAKLR